MPAEIGEEVARRFAPRLGAVDDQKGFEGFELLQPSDERTTWLAVTRWQDDNHSKFEARRSSPTFDHGHRGEGGESRPPMSTQAETLVVHRGRDLEGLTRTRSGFTPNGLEPGGIGYR